VKADEIKPGEGDANAATDDANAPTDGDGAGAGGEAQPEADYGATQ